MQNRSRLLLTIPVLCAFFGGGCIDAVSVGFANGVEAAISTTIDEVVSIALDSILNRADGAE